jgi:hypothetical protein
MIEQKRNPESMELELATAKAVNTKLRAALEKERTEKKELEDTLNNSFASSAQKHESEFPSTELEATAQHSDSNPSHQEAPRAATHTSFSVRDSVEEIQRWLYMEGGHMKDVEEMVSEYCMHVRKLGISLDRLFIGGLMLHPHVSVSWFYY